MLTPIRMASPALLMTGLAVALLTSPTPALAQYEISWWSVDGGGQTSAGGAYALTGVIGQPDAGVHTGGAHILRGGFLGVADTAPVVVTKRVVLDYLLGIGVLSPAEQAAADATGDGQIDIADVVLLPF